MTFTFARVGPAPVPARAREFRVRMRDGVRLATDVYLPDAGPGADPETALPAVLVRLPYDKNSRYVYCDEIAARFTARGYAVVVQDVRGKFRSEGPTVPFLREPDDGYDTIDWIVRQPWSDGLVGMFGDSYYGFTQWAAVSSQHPALRAIVPRVTTVDFNATTQSGSPVGRPVWLEGIEYYAHYWIDQGVYEYEPDRTVRPVIDQYEQAFRAIGARSTWFDLLAPRFTDLFPARGRHPFDARPVPVLHCVGWFDNIVIPHMRDYMELAARPGWDAVQYLWAGAVDHENYRLADAPATGESDHAASPAALDRMLPGYVDPALAFFDVFLKGVRRADELPKVQWELGHAEWRTAASWPPPDAVPHTLWLDAATGTLDTAAPTAAHLAQWTYDPQDLVPSVVENSFALLHSYPDLAPVAAREDVLCFTGPVLGEALNLAGPLALALQVTSTAPEFDVFAKLVDVRPDGRMRPIARGEVCVRTDEAPDEVRVDLGHTGYRVRPGHRLALLLASSDYPLYLPASGSAENPWTTLAPKPSTQTLRTGDAHPSSLVVTALPARP
ncbi:CocE/NonD family hydrolase [Streptomyces sp. SID14478]|uniref:CocE/NonD family hydrolase n=1 Tax=Streptomyces sp. SID14478 TaxID=2706073 RepID=UPI0013D95575|nr:CocE/NonD family hydrolase [Streptomyces sp. SID14478]NEB79374.1 CocE/NonD family hydrolase [Streptomyces sp. SID14478]